MGRLVPRLLLVLLAVVVLGGFALFRPFTFLKTPPPPKRVEVIWAFETPQGGAIVAGPAVDGDRVYAAVIHSTTFRNAGAVYCIDRAMGKQVWRFDDDGKMQHMYSSPVVADGRLYIGEGMHANFTCKLYCLDAATGKKIWDFVAEGHIESTPYVVEGKVYFSAGDDGLYCLDAVTGRKHWQFRGPLHLDSSPAVVGNRLYAGSGVSRTHQAMEALCLNTNDGKVIWRAPMDLPVWGSPIVAGDAVFFGLGNGRLQSGAEPPEKPAGALVCLNVKDGSRRWRQDADDAVFARATVGQQHVYFGSRDKHCYCLDRQTGRLCWRCDLGSPVMTSPVYLDGRLYVVSSGGQVCCLEAATGTVLWDFDVARHTQSTPMLYSSPVVTIERGEDAPARRIYFGSELRTASGNAAVLYCLGD